MADGRVIIVCGGRDYADRDRVFRVLDELHANHPIGLLRHGGAWGADRLAGEWGRARRVRVEVVHAEWMKHGPAAGPIRNGAMLVREPRPVLVVAFLGSAGIDMVQQAERAGVEVSRG